METHEIIGSGDAARQLGCSSDHVARLCRTGELECEKDGKSWRVKGVSIAAYLARTEKGFEAFKKRLSVERRAEYQNIPSSVAAQEVGYTADHIARLCRAGELTCTQEDGAWRVERESLNRYLLKKQESLENFKKKVSAERVNELTKHVRQAMRASMARTAAYLVTFVLVVAIIGGAAWMFVPRAQLQTLVRIPAQESQLALALIPQTWLETISSLLFPEPTYVPPQVFPHNRTQVASTPAKFPPTTIIQNPTQYITYSGLTPQLLDTRLAELEQRLSSRIPVFTGSPSGGGGGGTTVAYQTFVNSTKIDKLDGVDITGGSITDATITGGSVTTSSITGTLAITQGGTGTSTAPTYGQLLLGNSSGEYDLVATSSLGIVGGSGSADDPFAHTSAFGTTTSATTTPLWAKFGLFASSTSQFDNSTTTHATITSNFWLPSLSVGGLAVDAVGKVYSAATSTLATISGVLDLATQVGSSILAIANGGTGWAELQANTILLGNGTSRLATTSQGTNGQILSLVSGVPSWVATTTFNSPLSYASGAVSLSTAGDWTGTLDTLEAASFLRSDASDSYTSGTLTFDSGTALDLNTTSLSIADTGITFDGASTDFAFTGDFTVNTNDLTILKSSGNVGIGTTTPQWLLNPTSATAAQLALSAGAGVAQWAFRNAGGNLYFATTTVAGTATTSTSALTILGSSGYVGIGTTSPQASLFINAARDSSAVATTFAIGDGTYGLTMGNTTSSGFAPRIQSASLDSNDSLSLVSSILSGSDTGSTAAFTIDSRLSTGAVLTTRPVLQINNFTTNIATFLANGNVGIGTTSPYGLLSVENIGSDHSLYVTDQANDTTAFGVTTAGDAFVNLSTIRVGGLEFGVYETSGDANIEAISYSDTAADAGTLWLGHVRGTFGSESATLSGDTIGTIGALGWDTAASAPTAIEFLASANWGDTSTDAPFDILFNTVPDGTQTTAERMRITSNGNVGIGTTSPYTLLALSTTANNTDGPVLTFAQTDTTVIDPQRYGRISFTGQDADSPGERAYISVDAAGNASGVDMTFGTGAASGALEERLVITRTGAVGIATTSPWRTFSIVGTMAVNGLTLNTGAAAASVCLSSGNDVTRNTDNETCVASSERYKQDIETLSVKTDLLEELHPVSFEYKEKPGETHYGLIAEEVMGLDPLLVSYDDEGLPNGIRWSHITTMLIQGVQELYTSLAEIKNTLAGFADKIMTREIYVENRLCIGETCVTEQDLKDLLALRAQIANASTPPPSTPDPEDDEQPLINDTEPPVVTVLGNNPATISVGDSYVDLGATVTDSSTGSGQANQNLGIHTFINDIEVLAVSLDTSTSTTYTIIYRATDQAGNTGEAVRTVVVRDPESPVVDPPSPEASDGQGEVEPEPEIP